MRCQSKYVRASCSLHLPANPVDCIHGPIDMKGGGEEVKTLDRDVDYDQYISGVLNTTEYGSFTAGQFMSNLINNYTLDFNPKTNKLKKSVVVNQETGLVEQIATSPIQIRILESSNTNDMTTLPVTIAVSGKDGKITDTVITSDKQLKKYIHNLLEAEYGDPWRGDSQIEAAWTALAIKDTGVKDTWY